jgi:hypothetical protein
MDHDLNRHSPPREQLQGIPGWGSDLDRKNRPAVPMERTPPRFIHVPEGTAGTAGADRRSVLLAGAAGHHADLRHGPAAEVAVGRDPAPGLQAAGERPSPLADADRRRPRQHGRGHRRGPGARPRAECARGNGHPLRTAPQPGRAGAQGAHRHHGGGRPDDPASLAATAAGTSISTTPVALVAGACLSGGVAWVWVAAACSARTVPIAGSAASMASAVSRRKDSAFMMSSRIDGGAPRDGYGYRHVV